ncbi:MAG: asparagine synthetase B [Methanomassiliicoccales archaeon]|nr:MAG: asparagine synthetase B [Methanomassiliicoccales archaeon]
MKNHIRELKASLSKAVSSSMEGASRVGILFSGGLDSSLIALLAKKHSKKEKITLYTVGTADSHDLSNVEHASKLMDLNSEKIEVCTEDIVIALPKLSKIIGSHHPVKISFELPLYLGLANIGDDLILTGQGADELFGGYSRYLRMEGESLRVALEKDIKTLITNDIKMDYRLAEHFDKDLVIPYLEEKVVRIAMDIPTEYKVFKGQRKIILRKAAIQLGLPLSLAKRQKKASQYSSGIVKELRRAASDHGMGTNEYIEHLLSG